MQQKARYLIVIIILAVLIGTIYGLETLRGKRMAAEIDASLEPGDIPVFYDGELKAAFSPADIEDKPMASFKDIEEGKTQEGWMFNDVLLTYFNENLFNDKTIVTVISSSNEKSADLNWADINNPENMILFDLSGRGTLKLVSLMEGFDTRDDWVQDVDRIEITP